MAAKSCRLVESVGFAEIASPDAAVSDLIDRFQTENQELTLVVEDGRVVGLVTAMDAFEEITGELHDPLDEQFDLESDRT